MLGQKSFDTPKRENSFFQSGFLRVNGVVVAGFKVSLVGNGFGKFTAVQIAMVKNNLGQISIHKINCNQAAVYKRSSLEFQRIKFRKIQDAMVKSNVKKELVAHGKIDFFHRTMMEACRSQSNIIDFGTIKITTTKNTIDKTYRQKIALGEITTLKVAFFKFCMFDSVWLEMTLFKFLLQNIVAAHELRLCS